MANYTRKNAWNEKGSFDNPDLLWYAKAVGVMQSRSLNDPTSWWFYAAIHGQYIVNNDEPGTAPPTGYPNWADIPSPPNVPTAPVPEDTVIGVYWDQCQHAGWYFPPWHRGYLYAIENILRGIIQEIGGPADWALPYWDYFGPDNQYQIPPAFTQTYLPDGTTPNPLFVTARYGPQGNGNIYIPIPPVSQKCQQDTVYTDQYGGGVTGFDHFDSATGNLEQNPHNLVHNYVGGQVSQELWGLMADPGLAALDPIFYLHHSNIDRMWAAWNNAGNSNPTNDVNWMKGPEAIGERGFVMPTPSGQPWYYTPGDVNTTEQLGYTYDNLSLVVDATPAHRNTLRLRNLAGVNEPIKPTTDMTGGGATELVGANRAPITLGGAGARTAIHIDSSGWGQVTESLRNAAAKSLPDEVYLQLEGVKGYSDAQIYTVSVNHQYVGHISLFGIRMASTKNGPHGGAGLTIRLDITNVIDELFLKGITDPNVLDVLILPVGSVHGGECTVDKVSIYRKAQG